MAKSKGRRKGQPALEMDEYKNDPGSVRRRLRRGTLDPEIGRELLGGKHIDDWDLDELARGKPRASDGSFKGPKPAWLTPAMQEEAYTRFKDYIRGELSAGSRKALARIIRLIDEAESDRVSLDASKFTLEYLLGKPTQEVKGDVTMSIQHLLAGVLVNPDGQQAIEVEAETVSDEELEEDLDLEDEAD